MAQVSPKSSEGKELLLRRALYGGLFGAVGATAGWLVWISFQVGWRVLLAPVIGVLLEFIRKWYEYHQHVSATETAAAHANSNDESINRHSVQTSMRASLGRVVWFSLTVLLAILLGVAADLIKEILIPYLQSVITIFPVGAIFAVWFSDSQFRAANLPERIGLGAIGGMLATLASLLIFFALGGKAGVANIQSSWWVLVGICFAITYVDKASAGAASILAPFLSVIVILFMIGILVVFNLDHFVYGGIRVIPSTINAVLAGPDLPATSWSEVHFEQLDRTQNQQPRPNFMSRVVGCESLEALTVSRDRILLGCEDALATTYQCAIPACFNLEKDCSIQSLRSHDRSPAFEIEKSDPAVERANREQAAAICTRRREECEQAIERIRKDVANPDSISAIAREAQRNEEKTTPHIFRRRLLCRQLGIGLGSGLLRSFLAIVLFGAFWGVGTAQESLNRPVNYLTSRTRKLDQIVLGAMTVLTIVVIIVSRLH